MDLLRTMVISLTMFALTTKLTNEICSDEVNSFGTTHGKIMMKGTVRKARHPEARTIAALHKKE